MRIAVASGKGGTGKTTVAANLAWTSAQAGRAVAYLDCDVEEPNGALFLKPDFTESAPVLVSVPEVDQSKCTDCGLCGRICQYNAIAPINGKVLVFHDLCHGCAGCWMVCPSGAITEGQRRTGKVEWGSAGGVFCVQGLLDIGRAMSPPVIKAVKDAAPGDGLVIVDAPPGTSCPVIEAVRGSDFVLLVTEPTPFGLHDLKLAVEMVRALELPFAVAVNRAEEEPGETQLWCEQEDIPILAEIPDDRRVAEAYSRGELMSQALPRYEEVFAELLARLETQLGAVPHAAMKKDTA